MDNRKSISILKKEGFDIEASELTRAKTIRKQPLKTLETRVKLFIIQIANSSKERVSPKVIFLKKKWNIWSFKLHNWKEKQTI